MFPDLAGIQCGQRWYQGLASRRLRRSGKPSSRGKSTVGSKARCVTCDDCFFRKTNLCALRLSEPCPTFRPMLKGQMVPPQQPRLIARELAAAV